MPPAACSLPGCPSWAAGDLDGLPLCLDCVELVLDRLEAVYALPSLRETLPPLEYTPRGFTDADTPH